MSKVNCIQADWQQDVSAIAGLNAGGGAADSIATLIKDSFDIITDAEDTISRYDSDGEINSVFDTDSVGKYQLASFPTLTETLHKYSKNAPISIQNDIDLPFNMKLDDFLGAMSNVDIKGYSTAATGSLAKSGNFSTGQSGIVTLKDLLEPATPLGKQLKREYIEFKKQIGDDFTYEEYQMMAMNLASYDYDSFLEALAKGTAAFALTVAVTSIPVIGPIISLGMSGVGALEGFWGAATGNSLLTGRKLSGEEKVLSGLFGAMNLAFAGLTAYNSFFKGKVKIPSKKPKEVGTKYYPGKAGPLDDGVADTFTGGTYTETVLTTDTTMYRTSGGSAGEVGRYISRTPQNGGLQSQLDSALNPQWGNTATTVTEVTVPKGTVIYEGTAGPQIIKDSLGNRVGTLPGGGNQIYIPEVDASWFGK
ncbi:hypothetical protein ATZ33_13795 [Enterococcus silesiacus]|uniref:Pre-toxin TG domain-containing protein n=1 Tax=Enterococcus silesiacus TaxID=332949 RepID=A0A0S3KDZ1_9ENTE|nr:hypothetical protein [Enterococcus silesiacus]ALS02420.1 hypothetical protein ATZ33_13795 [Enterococcus silesiacus]OJG88184.1 hypothetical protein RV15_GL001843 [Enterococcus silesiacus]